MPLLYKSKVPYADHCINHTVGCAHNCSYCYARDQIAIPFKQVKDEADWLAYRLKPDVLINLANELIELEEKDKLKDIKDVHLCFSGDPFPYDLWNQEGWRIRNHTLWIIKKLVERGLQVTVLTKGVLPPPRVLVDADLLDKGVRWGITVVSLDENFRELHEPGAAPLASRIRALRELAMVREYTWVSMEPLPPPDFHLVDVTKLFWEVHWVQKVVLGRLNYHGKEKVWADWYKEQVDIVYELCRKWGPGFQVKDILGEKLTVMLP